MQRRKNVDNIYNIKLTLLLLVLLNLFFSSVPGPIDNEYGDYNRDDNTLVVFIAFDSARVILVCRHHINIQYQSVRLQLINLFSKQWLLFLPEY